MKKNKKIFLLTVSLALVFTFYACKRDAVEEPSPFGPSSFAVLLYLNANPNVLFAGFDSRQMASITATLKKYDGTPLADKTVFFETVDINGARVDLGYFEGATALQAKTTDGAGTVQINYYGPLIEEILANMTIYVRATVAWEGSQFVYETAPLYIIRDADTISFSVTAVPSVLYAGDTRAHSEITATLLLGGAPVKDFPVYFILQEEIGEFSDGKVNTYALTNAEGVASVVYVGPLWTEIWSPTKTVDILVKVTDTLSKTITLEIIRQK